MKVYLSGQITGCENYKQLFMSAQKHLEHYGYEVVNPVLIADQLPADTEREYMQHDLYFMLDKEVTHVAVMPGWKESLGATTEVFVANRYGIPIIDAVTFQNIAIYTEFELCNIKPKTNGK